MKTFLSPLTMEQESECLKKMKNGDLEARNELIERNMRLVAHVAKKYHVDFALKKDTTAEQPRYLVFFKSRDADAITAAFQEFASRKMGRDEKPSVRERLAQAREQAARKVEHRTLDREKARVKERGVEL